MAKDIVVVGGGVGGLTAALALGRNGHRVTVVERDGLPAHTGVEEAFCADRRGAPQVHQTHGFLARLAVLLRDRFPDVLQSVLDAGGAIMPVGTDLGDPEPGDGDLRVLIMRRATLDLVLRDAALAQRGVELVPGAAVAGLLTGEPAAEGIPVVTGVRLADGTEMPAAMVVAANGRRAPLPEWLGALGVALPETIVQSGLMYLSRWYRWTEGITDLEAKLGGDAGFLKYIAVPGDGETLSVTLAIRTDDSELRAALSDAKRFDRACELLPGPSTFFDGRPMEALTEVMPMAGLLNRVRRFTTPEGTPRVLGIHAIGDAHTCTNPLYGRGCSLAALQATMLADALAAHPEDKRARAAAYEEACNREILPWYRSAVQLDQMGADPNGGLALTGPPDADGSGGGTDSDTAHRAARTMGAVFAAAATDPVIARGFAKVMNMLIKPEELMSNAAFLERIAAIVADPYAHPLPPREGPNRRELLAALHSCAAA